MSPEKSPVSESVRQRAKELRQAMTPAEAALWAKLRNRRLNGLKFRRQHPIGRTITDFCCVQQRLVIEVDGGIHDMQVEHDQARTAYLEVRGYQVLRFRNEEVLGDMEGVLVRIVGALTP